MCIRDSFLAVHRTADTLLVVDPVMADDGSLYDGFDLSLIHILIASLGMMPVTASDQRRQQDSRVDKS